MKRILRALLAMALLPLAAALTLLAPQPAAAASLTQVTGFGTNPTHLNMYLYAPDHLAPKPALLVLVHYCGGSAQGIFGGNGHDYATAADQYGYLVVAPEATRDGHCFDVSTPAALRRDGGSDSTGIMAMVAWTRQHYDVDPSRIVVSGFSSGAMMTNVLAAEYPDVFSAASAFSGVPAGCFATSDGSLWNSQCSGGNIVRTAQQWGDLARSMDAGYAGTYPRMQVWHGTTDTTLAYPNFGEEIKQWTGLHGLNPTPASTDHPQSTWTRTRYGATGTQAPVEGISIANTGHTLPQPGMLAYAITFLGLDGGGTTPPPSTSGALHAVGAGKCLDVPNASTTAGTQLQIYGCWNGANQLWTRTGSRQLTVTLSGTTLCLDASNKQTANGTKVVAWPCNGGANQQWTFNANGTVTGVQSGLCLDVAGASSADGAPVQLWSCGGGSNQQWKLG